MFSIDLLVIIVIMSLLFLRHLWVHKDPNKINYTPVVLTLGLLGGVSHVMMGNFDATTMRESLLSISVGLIFFAVMSVMTQTVVVVNGHKSRERIEAVGDEIAQLNFVMTSFQERLETLAQMENSTHEQLRNIFREEIEALNVIQSNQKLFVMKIEALLAQQQNTMEKFEDFTLSELPSLDNVVHRHIDLLRVAEQDHFNQLKNVVRLSCDEQKEVHLQLDELREILLKSTTHQNVEHTITVMQKELDRIVHEFARHIQMISTKSEAIMDELQEHGGIIKNSREESEMIMRQMVLSSKQMREISAQSKEISDLLKPLSQLFASTEALHQEFLHARESLNELMVTLESHDRQDYRAMRQGLEEVAAHATAQMELFIQNIQKYEKMPLIETKNVQDLASKVKLQKSYLGENQE